MSGGGHGGEGGAVVLLTPTRPDADSVGALFIKDLTATRPDIAFTLQWQPAFLMGARAPGILSRLIQAAAARLSWYGAARLRLFRMFVLAGRVEAVAAVIRATGASRLWGTASSPEVIFIAEQLARRGVDLRVTVWDTPEYSAANLHLDDALVAQILASFAAVLRAIDNLDRKLTIVLIAHRISTLTGYDLQVRKDGGEVVFNVGSKPNRVGFGTK